MAVLMVVLYHLDGFLPGGFIGVDVFFVISGFVIARSLLRELEHSGAVDASRFLSRRVRRLLPALAVMLLATLVTSVLVLSPTGGLQASARTAIAASFSTANLQLLRNGGGYFDPDEAANPFLHTWSLSVEEQFYLAFPFLIALAWRIGRRQLSRPPDALLVIVVSLLAAASFSASVALSGGGLSSVLDDPGRVAFYSPITRIWEFSAGVLLALTAGRPARVHAGVMSGVAFAGAAGILWSSLAFDDGTVFPGAAAAIPVLGTVALIAGGTKSRVLRMLLELRALTWLGDRSYSWYLWHWPAIVFAGVLWPDDRVAMVAAGALSLVPAMISFRFVERPLRSGHIGQSLRSWRLAAICISIPALVGVGVWLAAERGLGLDPTDELSRRSAARDRGCHGDLDDSIRPPHECTWPGSGAGLVMLVGDSQAVSIADTVVRAGNQSGYDVLVQTRSLCPFHDRRVKRRGCAQYQRVTEELVAELEPDVLIIANRGPAYTLSPVGENLRPIVDADDVETSNHHDALAEWQAGLKSLLESVSGSADLTIVVQTVPEFEGAPGIDSISLLRPGGHPARLTLDEVSHRRAPTATIERRLADEIEGVATFDPLPLLCSNTCSQYRDGTWLYYDDDHLSLAGAELLLASIQSLIEDRSTPIAPAID